VNERSQSQETSVQATTGVAKPLRTEATTAAAEKPQKKQLGDVNDTVLDTGCWIMRWVQ